jgi:hypothetical protein
MSIKTIDTQIKGSKGIEKKINEGAKRMVFDILQSTQYSMPISSTIRELTTNACDSQREKEIAIEILSGEKKAEDYYITRGGAQYEDSNFNADYYNVLHLDDHKNKIDLTYTEVEGVGYCDIFSIMDYGVGIGARRLEGVLELGYSTKRNTSENFGAFGLGAKAALSTGVDFYTIETVYNGMRFKCNCYNYKTDFIIPSFNVETGKQNPFITFSDGTKVYYEESDSKNYTEVSFRVKKHNRRKYREAVEEQLNYLKNVNFTVVGESGYVEEVNFKNDVIYNSDHLIISDGYTYSKPHVLVVKNPQAETGINYGHIDFRELEMEQLYGAIAFKCPMRQVVVDDNGVETVIQEGVDVTPSREKVIWNEATKEYVQGIIKKAAIEATNVVQDELNTKDFLDWISKTRALVSGARSENRVLNKLSNIIDKDMISPTFPGDKRIRYSIPTKLFEGFKITKLSYEIDKGKFKSVRDDKLIVWGGLDPMHFYFKDDAPFNRLTDAYIIKGDEYECNPSVFSLEDLDAKFNPKIALAVGDAKTKLEAEKRRVERKRTAVLKYFKESEFYHSYDDVEVPEDWSVEFNTEEEQAMEVSKFDNISPAERREIEKRMVAYSLRFDKKRNDGKEYTLDKIEPKAKDLMESESRIYYCTKADEAQMHLAAKILHELAPTFKEVYPENTWSNWDTSQHDPVLYYEEPAVSLRETYGENKGSFYDWAIKAVKTWDTPQLIRVSENKVKYIKKNPNCKHISEFFLQINEKGGYTMDDSMITWFTSTKIEKITSFKFLSSFKSINPGLHKIYEKVIEARENSFDYYRHRDLENTDVYKQAEKLMEFQLYCKQVEGEDNASELISNKSKELFVLSDIGDCVGANIETLAMYENILEFSEDVHHLLSVIDGIEHSKDLSPELEKEIISYLQCKGKDQWDVSTCLPTESEPTQENQ